MPTPDYGTARQCCRHRPKWPATFATSMVLLPIKTIQHPYCGHQNMPGTNTNCPGTIPWTDWFNYFNTGSCNAVAVLPPNDYCGDECLPFMGHTCGGTTTGDINGATQSTAPIACGGYTSTGAKDVWFKFTATATVHDITVVPGAGLDAVIDLHRLPGHQRCRLRRCRWRRGSHRGFTCTGLTVGAVSIT